MKKIITLVAVTIGLAITFIAGVYIGHHKIFPYSYIQTLKNQSIRAIKQTSVKNYSEEEMLTEAMREPVQDLPLLYSPLKTLNDVYDKNQELLIRRESYKDSMRKISFVSVEAEHDNGRFPIIKLTYRFNNKNRTAYEYGRMERVCKATPNIIIIPGSGFNQSSAIWAEDDTNYQRGLLREAKNLGINPIVLIKPNEDYLAWHNGNQKKLAGEAIYNYQINSNGSYSVSYLVDSIAFGKWIRLCSKGKFVVAGVSQGGAASMLNALQTTPDGVVVASGHSVLFNKMDWSHVSQILGVPGYAELTDGTNLRRVLSESESNWLFTWGRLEYGAYRIETRNGITASYLDGLPNVTSVIHDGDHEFPIKEIRKWLITTILSGDIR